MSPANCLTLLNPRCANIRRSGSFGTAILSSLLITDDKNDDHDPESDLSGRDQRVQAWRAWQCWHRRRGSLFRWPHCAEWFPASDHGTSLDTLMSILRRLGIATTPVLFEHDELRRPAAAGHFALWCKSLCPAGLAQRQPRVRDEPGDW